ncbi:hypothetical protein [Caudoviricetes sp.]|nr:hypothetical protein [Caudoviricetes sp.]
MSYALIESELGDGRYRIKLDYGEAQRLALIAANEQALIQASKKLEVATEAANAAEVYEEAARAAIKALADQIAIVSESDPALVKPLQKLLDEAKERYIKLVGSNEPIRRQRDTLKEFCANAVRRRTAWTELQTISRRDAWCVDYTLNAQGTVATIDVPGDPSLILLAPECRAWNPGDGTVSTARKSGNISILQAKLKPLTDELGQIDGTLIPQAVAEEQALILTRNLALTAVQLFPTEANREALEKASSALDAKRQTLRQLRDRKAVLEYQISGLDLELARWSNRAASDSPFYGDGRYRARELCSPEQAYFNAAVFPGWQKFKPTYRWGTITYLDVDNNLANVTLGAANSTAQRLDVNQTPQLNGVSISYMTCNAEAFEVGDRVVIKFASQRWEEPTIIGFVDNPRQCQPWPEYVTMDVYYEAVNGPPMAFVPWAGVAWRGGSLAGWERIDGSGTGIFSSQQAPTCNHRIWAEYPVLGPQALPSYFTLNVEGGLYGVDLWVDSTSAQGYDGGGGPTAKVPSGGVCDTISLVQETASNVKINRYTTTSYSLSEITDFGIAYDEDGSNVRRAIASGGVWIHPGVPYEYYPVPFTTETLIDEPSVIEFLRSRGAAPTKISVTRGGQTSSSKEYLLASISSMTDVVPDVSTRTRWRLTFTKPE